MTHFITHAIALVFLCNQSVNAFQTPKFTTKRVNAFVRHVEPQVVAIGAAVAIAGGAAFWLSGSEDRAKKFKYADWERQENEILREREILAYIAPRDEEPWTEADMAKFDGSDETGPLLFAANGIVFNAWKGRHFYGPGCEYHIFAGRDATRLLAKSKLEEETDEERKVPLNIAERAALEGWMWTFKNKYEIVGQLEGHDPESTAIM